MANNPELEHVILENSTGIAHEGEKDDAMNAKEKSNLSFAMAKMREKGFRSVAIRLAPYEVINDQSRPRVWIIGSKTLSHEDLSVHIPKVVELLKANGPEDLFKLEEFLLPETDELVEKELARLSVTRMNATSSTETDCQFRQFLRAADPQQKDRKVKAGKLSSDEAYEGLERSFAKQSAPRTFV